MFHNHRVALIFRLNCMLGVSQDVPRSIYLLNIVVSVTNCAHPPFMIVDPSLLIQAERIKSIHARRIIEGAKFFGHRYERRIGRHPSPIHGHDLRKVLPTIFRFVLLDGDGLALLLECLAEEESFMVQIEGLEHLVGHHFLV